MDTEISQQLLATAERLASAAETLDRVLEKLDSQQSALNAKVDRIAAAVEERTVDAFEAADEGNNDLKGQAARLTRKTLSPLITALLSKSSVEVGDKLDPGVLDKTLQSLSVEQRVAVKAEMARAGMIE
jgi:uncharacterized protein YukE